VTASGRRAVSALAVAAALAAAGPGAAPAQTPDCTYARCPVASTGDARDVTVTARSARPRAVRFGQPRGASASAEPRHASHASSSAGATGRLTW